LARDAPLPADTAHLAIGPSFLRLIAGLANRNWRRTCYQYVQLAARIQFNKETS